MKAVIFDMDGTIIDSREEVMGAYKHTLEASGLEFDHAKVRKHVGRRLEDIYQSLAPGKDTEYLIRLHRSWQADNRHLLKGYHGLDEFLADIKKLGLETGLYTSAVRTRAIAALDVLSIREYFGAIICGDDVTKPKPHHQGVMMVADKLNVSPKDVIMVGDAEHDILAGKSAGSKTIAVTHGFGSEQSLKAAKPDKIVDNLADLYKAIKDLVND